MNISNVLKLVLASVVISFGSSAIADTLSDTKARGMLRCGVSQGLPGFSNPDESGNWSGIDVDVCRAVAAAIRCQQLLYDVFEARRRKMRESSQRSEQSVTAKQSI